MQKEFSVLPTKRGVDEDIRLSRIPIVNVVRRKLVVPFQCSGGGIERQDAVGEQIVAAAFAIIGVRPRIAGSPVERIGLGIIGTGLPGCTAASRDGRSLPRLKARIAVGRNGPVAPDAFAGGGFVRRKETADAPVAARDADHHHVFDHQRSHGSPVSLRFINHDDLPDRAARDTMQRDQVGVIGDQEDVLSENSHATVRPERWVGDQIRSPRARVMPDLVAGARVEREHLIRSCHVHDAVGHDRNGL